jgi:hypothetical protein
LIQQWTGASFEQTSIIALAFVQRYVTCGQQRFVFIDVARITIEIVVGMIVFDLNRYVASFW